jgi:hypothetical protein
MLFYCWVPNHAAVRGNERAHRLAGTAVISGGHAMDDADVLHALSEEGKVKDILKNKESSTMVRWSDLRDGQVKLSAARYEHYIGSQRRMVNQMRTSTVSRHTLLNVLERRSENLWVCPVYKDILITNHYGRRTSGTTYIFYIYYCSHCLLLLSRSEGGDSLHERGVCHCLPA